VHTGLDAGQQGLDLGQGVLVLFGGAKLQQHLRVFDVASQLFETLEGGFDAGTLFGDGLGFFGVVPKARRHGLLFELLDLAL
jgi:hypothetical protein